jgi:hypothetical protein
MAAKVDGAVKLAKQSLREGKCVIIGLQSTGPCIVLLLCLRNLYDSNGWPCDTSKSLSTLPFNHHLIGKCGAGESISSSVDGAEDCDQITSTTSGLLRAFIADHCDFLVNQDEWISRAEELDLPLNPLDELIDELGVQD